MATLAAALVPAACSPRGMTHTVTIKDMSFGPPPQNLKAGDTIEWVNEDIFEHTATARDGSFDTDLKPHDRANITVRRTTEVYCRFHPGMTLTLTVAP
jgi:plastocyanin